MAGFRTLVINRRCKLESQLGTLLIRGDSEQRIYIKEIETLIIESTAVALTTALLADLTEAGANVLICNNQHLPVAVFQPMHAHHSVSKNIKEQLGWSEQTKQSCFTQIVKEKIGQQASCLGKLGQEKNSSTLITLIEKVNEHNAETCEANAAWAYFKALFGDKFTRNAPDWHNIALNYGYSLLMATFAREIATCGYLTELGIWHKNNENAYNLASDLMEAFRPVVDYLVRQIGQKDYDEGKYKRQVVAIFRAVIEINGEKQSLVPAIRIYLNRVFKFMRGDVASIYPIKLVGYD
jgi:CRISPR-associated endonuclease Cas1 subtype II